MYNYMTAEQTERLNAIKDAILAMRESGGTGDGITPEEILAVLDGNGGDA